MKEKITNDEILSDFVDIYHAIQKIKQHEEYIKSLHPDYWELYLKVHRVPMVEILESLKEQR